MKRLLISACMLVHAASFGLIIKPSLFEDFDRPTPLKSCLLQIFWQQAPIGYQKVLYFNGPTIQKDPRFVEFVTGIEDSSGKELVLRTQFFAQYSWKYFLYSTPNRFYTGAYSYDMEESALIYDFSDNGLFALDLSPCRKYLGK